jgi:hypothetical protein
VKHRKFVGIHSFGNADVIRSLDAEENFQRKGFALTVVAGNKKSSSTPCSRRSGGGRWRNDSKGTALSFLSCDFAFL